MRVLVRLVVVVVAVSLGIAGCKQGVLMEVFLASLNAANPVPPCSSPATGDATISVFALAASYTINVFAASSTVTAAHIHAPALAGFTAPARVILFVGAVAPPVNGPLVQGVFTPSDVSGMSWATLLNHMQNGLAYVDVHTTNCPDGEIRGQLVKQ